VRNRSLPVITILFYGAAVCGPAVAAAHCERPAEAAAVQAAALQQEMAVAALMCNNVPGYNYFVITHRPDLLAADKALKDFFERANPGHGFDDYNSYKTDRANTASLRSHTDGGFCYKANANFRVATGRTLEETLAVAPFPAETGLDGCEQAVRPSAPVTYQPAPPAPPKKRSRKRTLLGKLVDAISP